MFWSYIGNIIFDLRNTNEEYKKIVESIENELEKHPNLRDVIDEDEVKSLAEEDVKSLIKIKKLFYDQQYLEQDAIFFAGGRNAYYYFKKMNLDNKIESKKKNDIKTLGKSFLTAYYDCFGELFGEVFYELEQNNKEYQEKQAKKNELLEQFPNLKDVVEMKKKISLSEEEVEVLLKYLDIKMDLGIIEEVAIMYRGMKEEYLLLKNMGIL